LKPGKVSEVKRTNTFIIEDCPALWELADSCAKLYNELNFERRLIYATGVSSIQSISKKIRPIDRLCNAQQIIKKSNAMINNLWSFSYIIRRGS
jgi:hypothetical protein